MNDSVDKPRRKIRIGDLLVQNKIISEQQLMQALSEQKRTGHKLGNTLVELGFVEEQKLLELLSQQLMIPDRFDSHAIGTGDCAETAGNHCTSLSGDSD